MKYLLIIAAIILSLSGYAQLPEAQRGEGNVISQDANIHVTNIATIPADTITTAATNSIAIKNGVFYVKKTYWEPVIGVVTITTSQRIFLVDDSTNTQPVSTPDDSTYYLLGGAPSGVDWGAFPAHSIALYTTAGGWEFITGAVNDYAITIDDQKYHQFNGTTWPLVSGIPLLTVGNIGPVRAGTTNASIFRIVTANTARITIAANGDITFNKLTGSDTAFMMLGPGGVAYRRFPETTTDTTNIKPIGTSTTGKPYRLTYWPGSGGGGGVSTLFPVTGTGTATGDVTGDHTGFTLTTTGLNNEISADNVVRIAAVDSIALTSLGTGDFQAGTTLKLAGVDVLVKGSTSTSTGFGSGGTVTKGWNSNTGGTYLVGGENMTGVATIKQAVYDTVSGLTGWQNPSSGTPLTATHVGFGDGSNLLTGSANMTYASSVFNVFRNGIGNTQTDGVTLQNSTAATAGNPQYSPRFVLQGYNWTTGSSASVDNRFGISVVTQSAASPIAYLAFNSSVGGAAYSTTPILSVHTSGKIGINNAAPTSTALDIIAPSGGSSLILRDPTAAGANSFTVATTGVITLSQGMTTTGTFTGAISSGTAGAGATNFHSLINSGTGNSGAAYAGSGNLTSVRVISNPTTTATVTAGNNYSTFQIGAGAITKAGSSTHDMFSNMSVLGLNINSGAATLTRYSTFVINGPATGTGAPTGFANGTFLVHSGVSQFNGAMRLAYVAKTATYTATTTDYFIDCTANSFTVNLPAAATCTGVVYVIKNSASGTTITIDADASETIDGATTQTLTTQYSYYKLISDGAGWKLF